jgi:glyoxylase-like metal-dependent hydrolase (beta-lactamase superfamily II)
MTKQGNPQLDLGPARELPPEQAAFFFLGPSKPVADGVAFLSSFANVAAFMGETGIPLVDTSSERFTRRVLDDLRQNYSNTPVEAVVYTRGHLDHVTGAEKIMKEAQARGGLGRYARGDALCSER